MRSIEDIQTTGAAWVTESELRWLCSEVERLRLRVHDTEMTEAIWRARAEKAEAEVERLRDDLSAAHDDAVRLNELRLLAEAELAQWHEGNTECCLQRREAQCARAELEAEVERLRNLVVSLGGKPCKIERQRQARAALRGGKEREECGYCGSQLCTGSCQI